MKHFTVKIGAAAAALMLAFPAFSQITLQYNFKKGDILRQNMSMNMEMEQSLMGQTMTISMEIVMKATYEVKEIQGDNYVMEMKIKETKLSGGAGGMNMTFDSNTPEDIATEEDFGPMLKAIVDKPVETVMSKTGKVESVKGSEKFREAMFNSLDANIPEERRRQLVGQYGSNFSEESLKSTFEQTSNYFPDKPVKPGDSWNFTTSMASSGLAINIDMKLTLKSIEGNVVTLDGEGTVSTPEGYEQEMNGMKVKVNLKGTQTGEIKLDRNTGWIISSTITQSFGGEMEGMGMKIPISAKSTASVTDK